MTKLVENVVCINQLASIRLRDAAFERCFEDRAFAASKISPL